MMSSSADSPLVCFFVQARLGGRPAAGSGAFPPRELSVQERVSSADSSLVHFLVKSRQIKRAERDLFRNTILLDNNGFGGSREVGSDLFIYLFDY